MPSFLIRGLARYAAASAMESRERRRSSYTPSSDSPSKDDTKLSKADLADWQTQMRWLLPLVQATGHRIVIENPKSHEQIVIDKDTKELPLLSLEWMQKYNRQELLEWMAKEKERHIKKEEERQRKLQDRRIAESKGRKRFGSSFTLDEADVKANTNNSQNTNTKGISNYIIPILCLYVFVLFLVGLWVYNSPAFSTERHDKDNQEYYTLLNEAEDSPITVLVTPESFRFDMNEEEVNARKEQRKYYVIDYSTKYDWLFGNVHYAGDQVFGEEYHDGKLCSYMINIEGRMLNGSIRELNDNDVKIICDHYKAFLGKDYVFAELPGLLWGIYEVYIFTKGNMVISLKYRHNELYITCENRPVSAPIEREKDRAREEERKKHRYVPPNPYAYP